MKCKECDKEVVCNEHPGGKITEGQFDKEFDETYFYICHSCADEGAGLGMVCHMCKFGGKNYYYEKYNQHQLTEAIFLSVT